MRFLSIILVAIILLSCGHNKIRYSHKKDFENKEVVQSEERKSQEIQDQKLFRNDPVSNPHSEEFAEDNPIEEELDEKTELRHRPKSELRINTKKEIDRTSKLKTNTYKKEITQKTSKPGRKGIYVGIAMLLIGVVLIIIGVNIRSGIYNFIPLALGFIIGLASLFVIISGLITYNDQNEGSGDSSFSFVQQIEKYPPTTKNQRQARILGWIILSLIGTSLLLAVISNEAFVVTLFWIVLAVLGLFIAWLVKVILFRRETKRNKRTRSSSVFGWLALVFAILTGLAFIITAIDGGALTGILIIVMAIPTLVFFFIWLGKFASGN
jgi:MFS family permease